MVKTTRRLDQNFDRSEQRRINDDLLLAGIEYATVAAKYNIQSVLE